MSIFQKFHGKSRKIDRGMRTIESKGARPVSDFDFSVNSETPG